MPPTTRSATPAPPTAVDIQDDAVRLDISFRPHTRRVAHLRHIAGALLAEGGIGQDVVETVQLLVSEIVTNAVVHGCADRVRFSVSYDRSGRDDVLIEVDDGHPARIKVRSPGSDDETGRGMFLVDALARAWGRHGTRTWCTVATGEAP
ncbi:ATP-binding protein [Streptomyces sp. NBC_00838]|uniref:ATP-binding protein n=1 Tax=Streptomyces sp. NBC_00838 TaxID=2903680 RepID=UPI003865896C|nr:ATP-binding protein [Streptomyces sp. NBC_00838]